MAIRPTFDPRNRVQAMGNDAAIAQYGSKMHGTPGLQLIGNGTTDAPVNTINPNDALAPQNLTYGNTDAKGNPISMAATTGQYPGAVMPGQGQAGQGVMANGISPTLMPWEQPAPEAPALLQAKALEDFGVAYAQNMPKLRDAKNLAEYDANFQKIFDSVPGAAAANPQIYDKYYQQYMPDAIKTEKRDKLMRDEIKKAGQSDKYEVINGQKVIKPEWQTKQYEDASYRIKARDIELQSTAEENKIANEQLREKARRKGGLGQLGNEAWQGLETKAQAEEWKVYREFGKQLRDLDKEYRKAQSADEPKTAKEITAQRRELEAAKKEMEDTYGLGKKKEAEPTAVTQPHPQDQQAVEWAKANPNDPRSQQILSVNQQ